MASKSTHCLIPYPTGLFFIYCLNKILPSWRTIILSVKTSQSSLYSLRISQNTIWKLPDTINFIKIRVLPEEVSSIVHSVKVLPLLQKVHLSHDRVDTFLYGGGCLCSRTCKLIHATTLRCPCKSQCWWMHSCVTGLHFLLCFLSWAATCCSW